MPAQALSCRSDLLRMLLLGLLLHVCLQRPAGFAEDPSTAHSGWLLLLRSRTSLGSEEEEAAAATAAGAVQVPRAVLIIAIASARGMLPGIAALPLVPCMPASAAGAAVLHAVAAARTVSAYSGAMGLLSAAWACAAALLACWLLAAARPCCTWAAAAAAGP